jgi:hypothetical protein
MAEPLAARHIEDSVNSAELLALHAKITGGKVRGEGGGGSLSHPPRIVETDCEPRAGLTDRRERDFHLSPMASCTLGMRNP